MRLFIALRLSPGMEKAVAELQDSLYRQGVRGNFPPPENLHVTLAFIGEYPDPDAVLDAMETVDFAPFPLELSGVGRFGDLWWAGLAESPALADTVRRLRKALAEAGIPFDRKKFSPHITLGRKLRFPDENRIPGPPRKVGMTVDKLSLMESVRGKNGMIYTEIGFVPAKEGKE